MIGRSVGKYRILDRIGRGGMGTVYRAVDDSLERHVAIKVLNSEVTEPEALRRFRAEAITLAKLNHPGIATLFELYQDDGDLLMVMEFVQGETLQKLSDRMGQLPPDFAAQLCAQGLDALSYAHRVGIIHRDLKPGNLMLTDEGVVKVMDFGIARILGSEHLTSDGFMMGTPAYMAPEQVLGQEVDARSDVYAMGVVLYRLLTGRLPFQADTPIAIAQKQLNHPPTPLSVACPDLPSWCDTVLARALAKSPADRFQTAQDFKAALLSCATFISLDDLATRTMPTPRSIPRDSFMPGTAPVVSGSGPIAQGESGARGLTADSSRSRSSASLERPATGTSTPRSERTVVISGRHFFAGMGALVLLIVALAIVVVFAIRRPQSPASSNAPLNAPQTQATAPVPPVPVPPSTDTPAAVASKPVPPPPPSAGVTPETISAKKETGTPVTAAGARNGKVAPDANRTSASTTVADADPAAAAASGNSGEAAALPPVTFDKLKLVVIEGDRGREQDAKLLLADGRISLYGPGSRVMASVPYRSVVGLSSARSRQPRWPKADGTDGEAKISGGALGFMKSDRNWLAIRTQDAVYVLRIDDGRLARVIQTATERTGTPIVRLAQK